MTGSLLSRENQVRMSGKMLNMVSLAYGKKQDSILILQLLSAHMKDWDTERQLER